MPINGVLDLQRRSLPLGEIRIGESEPVPGKNYRKPVRRKTFLFTTPVEETAHAIAAKFGGTPKPWDRREGYWAVDTDHAALEVWVPPRGLAVDAWMEMWDGGKCRRRCDGITEQRSGAPCMCPQPDDRTDPADVARAAAERKRLATLTPPQGCKPITRIKVQIPGLPGVTGVWVLRTGSANAAVETADTGEVLERARSRDVYLPALMLIHWRPGQDGHPYPVLTLRLRPSAEQVAQLPAGRDGMLAQLQAPAGTLALTAGTPPAAEAATPTAAPPATEAASPVTAEQIATGIPLAQSREDVAKLIEAAKAAEVLGNKLWYAAQPGDAETEEILRDLLDARWWELPGPPKVAKSTRASRAQNGPVEAHAARPVAVATPPGSDEGSLFDADDPTWGGAA